jgi:acyl-CoA synthetase (NDP forming)
MLTPKRDMDPLGSNPIEHLFHPRNVVLVGASDRHDHWSKRVWDNLQRFGFAGRVFPVNPGRSTIWGLPCFPTLDVLPETPDHLAIFTPAATAVQILRDGGSAGARSATLYAAGFGEGGDAEGLRLAAQLRTVLADTGLAVVGASCMGVACGKSGFATIPDETLQALAPSPVAVVAQSGAICGSINRAINELGLRVAFMASCGSQMGCRISDFIDYLADQPELKVVLCYIEAIPDAPRFLAAARKARQNGKTIVAVKIGGSDSARASALAHTGSLAGRSEVFEVFAAAAGIVRLLSLEDAVEAVEFLARKPLPRGRNIAVMTNSGALSTLTTEAADRTGAKLVPFSDATADALRQALGQKDLANPLDTKRTIPTAQYRACLDAIVNAPEVDIVLVAEELPLGEGAERRVANVRSLEDLADRAAALGKSVAMFTPLLVGTTDYGRGVRAQVLNVPVLRDTERTLRVIRALAEAGTRPLASGALFATPADTDLTRQWRTRATGLDGPVALNEVESKALLRAYGIPVPDERLVGTAGEAREVARTIGFPVVLKAVSADITHKSDAGLVLLNVADAQAVDRGVAALKQRAAAHGARIDGILVAQQITGGTETVLGISRDVEMGLVVMFGMGGVWIELFKDVSFGPANLTREQALAMIKATRAGLLLDGFRGSKPGDLDALADALVDLGRLAGDLGDVIEAVDINPFVVRERGHGAFALDGLVVLRPPAAGNVPSEREPRRAVAQST